MAIYNTEGIKINGSQNFLGGQVYTLNYEQGFNGESSAVEAGIVAASANYQIPVLGFKTPYNINIGGDGRGIQPEYKLKMYAYKYCMNDGQNGRILTVYFKDNVNRFRKYWIAPIGEVCSSPNVILLGSPISNEESGGNPDQKIISYNYSDFYASTQFLGIPLITSNEYTRLNSQGTVLEVFNQFMNLYGFSWYLDEDDQVILIDIKKPIDISDSIARLETHPRKLNSTICEDISNNFARGVVALDDITEEDVENLIINDAIPIWDGTDENDALFLGNSFNSFYGPVAALYALMGEEVYFSYIWSKFGLQSALQAFGYHIWDEFTLLNAPSDLKTSLSSADVDNAPFKGLPPVQLSNVSIFVTSQDDQSLKTITAFEKDKALGELLKNGYYTIKDINPTIQWLEGSPSLLNPETKLKDLSEFGGLLPYEKRIRDIQQNNVWLLKYPKNVGSNQPTVVDIILDKLTPVVESPFTKALMIQIHQRYPQKIPTGIDKIYGGPDTTKSYILVDINNTNGIAPPALPKISYPFGATRLVAGIAKSPDDIRFPLPSYGLNGRKITQCSIPDITEDKDIASIDVKTMENLTTKIQDVDAFIAQSVFKRKQTDKSYTADVRGITSRVAPDDDSLTPKDGLDSFSIRLDGENGYSTSYSLTSKRTVPQEIETFRPKQKSTIN